MPSAAPHHSVSCRPCASRYGLHGFAFFLPAFTDNIPIYAPNLEWILGEICEFDLRERGRCHTRTASARRRARHPRPCVTSLSKSCGAAEKRRTGFLSPMSPRLVAYVFHSSRGRWEIARGGDLPCGPAVPELKRAKWFTALCMAPAAAPGAAIADAVAAAGHDSRTATAAGAGPRRPGGPPSPSGPCKGAGADPYATVGPALAAARAPRSARAQRRCPGLRTVTRATRRPTVSRSPPPRPIYCGCYPRAPHQKLGWPGLAPWAGHKHRCQLEPPSLAWPATAATTPAALSDSLLRLPTPRPTLNLLNHRTWLRAAAPQSHCFASPRAPRCAPRCTCGWPFSRSPPWACARCSPPRRRGIKRCAPPTR